MVELEWYVLLDSLWWLLADFFLEVLPAVGARVQRGQAGHQGSRVVLSLLRRLVRVVRRGGVYLITTKSMFKYVQYTHAGNVVARSGSVFRHAFFSLSARMKYIVLLAPRAKKHQDLSDAVHGLHQKTFFFFCARNGDLSPGDVTWKTNVFEHTCMYRRTWKNECF